MSSKLTALTAATDFLDTDIDYIVKDPGGSPLSRKVTSLTRQRYYPMPQNGITGLTLSNNVSDANNDVDIAVGRVGADTGDYNLILTAARTKQLDAVWAVGTNQGGLDTGAKAISTWYHVWLIARVDTHVVDMLYSTSATAPTMPASYTKKRRIGAVKTDASGNLLPFLQYDDNFLWKSPPALDVDTAVLSTTRLDYALVSVPAGVVLQALVNITVTGAATRTVYISNPNLTDLAPSSAATPLSTNTSVVAAPIFDKISLYTDINAKISARSNNSATTFKVAVLGWTDPRGKY